MQTPRKEEVPVDAADVDGEQAHINHENDPESINLSSLIHRGFKKKEMDKLPMSAFLPKLQNIFDHCHITPECELVQIEGELGRPSYRFTIVVSDIIARGVGKSKKRAKQAAAKIFLNKLLLPCQPINRDFPETDGVVVSARNSLLENPVGRLQELCISRHWPLPSYYDENTYGGELDNPEFKVFCTLMDRRVVGTSAYKKQAKRRAAFQMWHSMQNNPPAPFRPNGEVIDWSNAGMIFMQLLQDYAWEQSFNIIYIDVEEKSITGLYQCVIQIFITPVAICYGSGFTRFHARTTAAQNALEFLKISTRFEFDDPAS